MVLSYSGIKNEDWIKAGYTMPQFDVENVRENTLENPQWLHFGAGNIFRMFPARLQQELLDKGLANTGVLVCEAFDEELVHSVFEPYDNLSVAVSLHADSRIEKTVVASVAGCWTASNNEDKLINIFENKSLQIVSFTITEKGYAVSPLTKLLVMLLNKRYLAGAVPVALLSLDNCSQNGDKLRAAVEKVAEETGADASFIEFLRNNVAYPLSMIDKITPRPSEIVKKKLEADGLENINIIETSKHTFASCFVNAEKPEYLVIEDKFPNGRPLWENAGAIFTDRKTVEAVESMKVRTCLNPLHTVLGVFGCLLGHKYISDTMKDTQLTELIKHIGFDEAMPVVTDPGIINPSDFLNEVLNERFPNPFVPDTPQRIVCDSSQKIPVRFGETLKSYKAENRRIDELKYIPLFFAGWLRYLQGIDDYGITFEPSPDPLLNELRNKLENNIHGILSDNTIFGIDLYECGLGKAVECYLNEMQGTGAVRNTLIKHL